MSIFANFMELIKLEVMSLCSLNIVHEVLFKIFSMIIQIGMMCSSEFNKQKHNYAEKNPEKFSGKANS